jgi:hypothetical protein
MRINFCEYFENFTILVKGLSNLDQLVPLNTDSISGPSARLLINLGKWTQTFPNNSPFHPLVKSSSDQFIPTHPFWSIHPHSSFLINSSPLMLSDQFIPSPPPLIDSAHLLLSSIQPTSSSHRFSPPPPLIDSALLLLWSLEPTSSDQFSPHPSLIDSAHLILLIISSPQIN